MSMIPGNKPPQLAPARVSAHVARRAAEPLEPRVVSLSHTPSQSPSPLGLVTYDITGREPELSVREVWSPRFPSADLVGIAAGLFTPARPWQGGEGPRWSIMVSPGSVAVESHDAARAERAYERQLQARQAMQAAIAVYFAEHGHMPPDAPAREITSWSTRSRSRMTRRLCELDYAPLLKDHDSIPVMITLTYPGDWLTVAPDGKAVKKHMAMFRRRWYRRWATQPVGPWKLEFQRRGAPHVHLLTVLPGGSSQFRAWLSATWADVVNHPDPVQRMKHEMAGTGVDFATGLRSRDPRRIAVYFTKHGSFVAKEYQNVVPKQWQVRGKGPGRFWGIWGLDRCVAAVEVSPDSAVKAARTMRRWAHAQGTTREVRAPRVRGGMVRSAYPDVIGLSGAMLLREHPVRKRRVRRRVRRMAYGRGWISLNDGPLFASQLARYIG
jgi:hypothetical protein